MKTRRIWRTLAATVSFAAMLSVGSAAELNSAALVYKKPDQIPCRPVHAAGAQQAEQPALLRRAEP